MSNLVHFTDLYMDEKEYSDIVMLVHELREQYDSLCFFQMENAQHTKLIKKAADTIEKLIDPDYGRGSGA